jgi:oligopeptide/dipeptide ABC transporter ATP-binding protein
VTAAAENRDNGAALPAGPAALPAGTTPGPALLDVAGLSVRVGHRNRSYRVVDEVSLRLPAGRALGIVGESGSGKSLTLRALMALLPPAVWPEGGSVALAGALLPLAGRGARRARRRRMAMVFQDSLSALNPVQTVGAQIAEVPRLVLGMARRAAWARAIELLDLVGIPSPATRARAYPHQLSGGMRQRVAIAIALAAEPEVLLCDEPTTALDVTVQAQVLELIGSLRRRLGFALIFVSHDIAVVGQVCEEIAVMYTGRIVETGPVGEVLTSPAHPYTRALLAAVIDLDDGAAPAQPIPGAIPDPARLPAGCSFHPRCPLAGPECTVAPVPLLAVAGAVGERLSACLHRDLVGRR